MMDYASQKSYIRDLAGQIREIADSPATAASRRRWCDVNALRKPDRAPVYCRPVAAWDELLPDDSLLCADPRLRTLEAAFRRMLIKKDIGDDSIVLPYIPVEAVFETHPPNLYGVDIIRHETVQGGAWGYAPVLREEADFDKLTMPIYTYNREKTEETASFTNEIIGDILESRICVTPTEYGTICSLAADLRGMEQIMLDAIENPGLLHRLMAYSCDAALSKMEQMQDTGLLTPNTNDVMYMTDEISPPPGYPVTYHHCFGIGNSQEFDQISPGMWEEFLLQYQRRIYERFGLAAYGCCEDLTRKIDGVLTLPNLRVFVCSAWTNLDTVIDRLGRGYTVMWRQKASDVCFADDISSIEAHLGSGCERLKGGYFQIVLREIQTLNGNMNRLHIWTELAKEAAAKNT